MMTGFSVHRLCAIGGMVLAALLVLPACSPNDSAAQTAGGGTKSQTITIVRERRPEDPAAYLKMMRNTLARCQETKAELARVLGKPYDPQAEALSDDELMKLETEVTEEYFDGDRYAKVVNSSLLKTELWGPNEGESCRPVAKRIRNIRLQPTRCKQIDVAYDLDEGTGIREQAEDICAPRSSGSAEPMGELVDIPGTGHRCRWNVAEGGAPARACLLDPLHFYPSTGADLVVMSTSARQALPAQFPIDDMAMIANGVATVERPLRVEIGKPIAPGVFEVPADAKAFPLSDGRG